MNADDFRRIAISFEGAEEGSRRARRIFVWDQRRGQMIDRLGNDSVAMTRRLAGDNHTDRICTPVQCLMLLPWRNFNSLAWSKNKQMMFDFKSHPPQVRRKTAVREHVSAGPHLFPWA